MSYSIFSRSSIFFASEDESPIPKPTVKSTGRSDELVKNFVADFTTSQSHKEGETGS